MNISKQSQERIDWLQAMPTAAQFEAIAMNIKNPAIFSQFLALDEEASIWDYAYAAGLISKADANFAKTEDEDNSTGSVVNPVSGGENAGENATPGVIPNPGNLDPETTT